MADGIQFEDNRIKVEEAITDKAIAFLYEAVAELQGQTIRNSRVDKGQTKGSWDTHVDEANLEASVGSPLENAIWEELGTGEYALQNNGRTSPWYVPVEGYTGKKKPTFNGAVVVVYGKDGTAYYKTNGKKPNRALWNAFQSSKSKLIKRAEALMKELNGK